MELHSTFLLLITVELCWVRGVCGLAGNPLGLESGVIPDSSFTASSEYNANHAPWRGRLNLIADSNGAGAWVARASNADQWIQVDLLATYRITGVATQGRQDYPQWTTSYIVSCSMDGLVFNTVKDPVNPGSDKTFPANNDQNTEVFNPLPEDKACRYVRLQPVTWRGNVALRMELYGEGPIEVTTTEEAITTTRPTTITLQPEAMTSVGLAGNPLGLESGVIPDSSFTASSEYNANHAPWRGRLNLIADSNGAGAWVARASNADQWIQVDLLATYRITGVATQGRQDYAQWTTSYIVSCSMDGLVFNTVKDPVNPGSDKTFPANNDQNTEVFNPLPEDKVCRYVRLQPVTWHGNIALRMEFYGEGPIEVTATNPTTEEVTITTKPTTTLQPEAMTTRTDMGPVFTPAANPAWGRALAPELRTAASLSTPVELTTPDGFATRDELTSPDELATPDGLSTHNELTTPDGLAIPDELTAPGELATPFQFTETKAVSSPTGVREWLLEMNNEDTIFLSFGIPIVVYFICLCMALLLRTIFLLRRSKKEPPVMERPQRMYELVNI
ncbi:lactadherin-like [Lytechinus variegatus]|uniref:lactadherin-like n=1 Tax=Lytechinus variegatus TaxID=7654 RepID=UPI001BB164C6|nr:lactadherin-like [Lytechinus variegatus]